MKRASLVTGLAAALVLAGTTATLAGAVADQLGTAWNVRETDWDGVWTRRGTSNVFDAVWTQRYILKKITAVLTITVKGNAVSIQRRNGSDGADVNYTGTIGGDGITVTGTGKVLPNRFTYGWQARIQGGIGTTAPPAPPVQSPPARSLTGPWVHSADPTFKTHDSKVIVIQEGTQVTITQTCKYHGRWMVNVCRGALSGTRLRADCNYAPGGNPFGFAAGAATWIVSQDGNHLDGTIIGGQESHYSRIP